MPQNENLLLRDTSISVYIRNIQILAKKMFEANRDLSPPIFKELSYQTALNYQLRHSLQFHKLKMFVMGTKVKLL